MKTLGFLLIFAAVMLALSMITGVIVNIVGFGTVGSWVIIVVVWIIGVVLHASSAQSEGASN